MRGVELESDLLEQKVGKKQLAMFRYSTIRRTGRSDSTFWSEEWAKIGLKAEIAGEEYQ